jgi:RNA polymerase sigma factor (TIGR02999 family)
LADPRPDRTTELLEAAGRGDRRAAAEIVPILYQELRRLACIRMAKVPPGNTLQPTALVHEAYLRLVGDPDRKWDGRGHFFAAAAEAMRQILVDQTRRKAARKHGGGLERVSEDVPELALQVPGDDVLALHDALDRLEKHDRRKAEIVKLRYFVGLTRDEAAAALGISVRTVDREWRYIVARLHAELAESGPDPEDE